MKSRNYAGISLLASLAACLVSQAQMPFADGGCSISGTFKHVCHGVLFGTDNHFYISSDNGPVVDDGYKDKAEELLNGHTPSGPWRGNKYSAFEGGTAVPVIVRWPQKIKQTGDSDVLMSQIDWLASLGALINARLPKGSAPDSYDRLGNLIGTDKTDRPWIVEQSMNHTLL